MADDEPASKRRRMQNACDECRRRKIRCDSATAPGNKRGPKIGPSKKADNARNLVNAILSSSKPFVIPEDPESIREILVDLANHARSLDRQLALAQSTFDHDASSASATTSPPASNDVPEAEPGEVEDSIDQLAAELRQVTLSHQKRHFGKSSNFMLVQSAMDARRDALGDRAFTFAIFKQCQRPDFWKPFPWQQSVEIKVTPFVFPEDDLLRDLIEIYFTRHNPFFPLLHRPTFERLIKEGLHLSNRSFGATVLAICAVASRQSNDPRTLCEGTTSEHSLGWKYFRQIPLIRDSFTEPPSIYDIQLCSLAVFYLQTTSTPEAAWTMVGIGIRSAQEMGLHRRSASSDNTVEDELWKRAFWLLISIDLFMSAFLGRPRATTPDDFDCDLPSECDDEYWETPDPKQAFVQPTGKPSILSFFVTFIKLLDIVGFGQRTLYSVRKSELWSGMGISGIDWKRKAVIELDSALNKFVDQIPDHLKWDPEMSDPVFFQQSALLHSTYHWVQIQVHRPFIPRPGQEPVLPFPSLAICSNAARKIIHIMETLQNRRDRGMIALEMVPNILTPLFAAALILLVSIWRPQRAKSTLETEKEMADVYRCVKLISKYEERYQTAGRIVDILNAVITVGQLPRAKESLKRPRSPDGDEPRATRTGSGPSNVQVVLEDLHDEFHRSHANPESTTHNTINALNEPTPFPYQTATPMSLPSYSDNLLSTMGPFGGDPLGPTSTARAPNPMGGEIGTDALMSTFATANDFMLQQPDSMWYPPAASTSGNADFTQDDWNSFMSSVDDIMNGAADYRGF
ncbi:Gypsy retrotransposon integrase-like protein 1 [Marasmius sp. AFHP31]|nr:Gypsy retrotransposon integrase-like protein 1 [Marasmius sp. AFHP31]